MNKHVTSYPISKTIPKTMTAVAMTAFPEQGKVVEQLKMITTSTPEPKSDEVTIALKASSMHPDEIYAAQGTALGRFFGPKNVSPDNPYILGSSVSGIVVALGNKVSSFAIGDEVIAVPEHTMEHSSWATYRCVSADMVRRKPVQMSHVDAAAVTMASCVAWGAVSFADIKAGDRCLVIGASGAIGIMELQFLKSMGAHVTAVCSHRNEAMVREYGADEVVDYTKHSFANKAARSGIHYDGVFDCVGGRKIERDTFRVLKTKGRFITVVGPKQHIGETKLSWAEVAGVIFYVARRYLQTRLSKQRYIFGEKFPRNCIDKAMAQLVEHQMNMPIDREIPFQIDPIKDAIRHLMSHRTKGRIVINFDLPK